MNMNPLMIRRMVQKIRRLAPSLGIENVPPVHQRMRSVKVHIFIGHKSNAPTAHRRQTFRCSSQVRREDEISLWTS